MDEGWHAAEGMKREIGGCDVGAKRVHLDLRIGHSLLGQREAGDPDIDTVAITVQDEAHGSLSGSLGAPGKAVGSLTLAGQPLITLAHGFRPRRVARGSCI